MGCEPEKQTMSEGRALKQLGRALGHESMSSAVASVSLRVPGQKGLTKQEAIE